MATAFVDKVRTIKASELVEDFDLYPRGDVDSTHVSNLVEAMAADIRLPPIIACANTRRIVDGFHRRRAWIRHTGKQDCQVPVLLHKYANDAELFAEAIRRNAAHGRRLTPYDYTRSLTRGQELGMPVSVIAECLHVTVDKLAVLTKTRVASHLTKPFALKRTIEHMAGREMNETQVKANDSLSGMNQVFYVNQLITLFESELLDVENDELKVRLRRLGELIATL